MNEPVVAHTSTPPNNRWYIRLESDSSRASTEDTESVYSVQDKETDVARDTSDTDTKSESDASSYEVVNELEYEVASMSENENNLLGLCSSSGSDALSDTGDVIAAVLADSSLEAWASDYEDSDTSDFEEFEMTDFWICAQCKSKNNNPLYRLCEKCFQEKKNLYPPRPRRPWKKRAAPVGKVNVDKLRSCLSGLSRDSRAESASSQAIGIDFEQIQVPPQKDSGIVMSEFAATANALSGSASADDAQVSADERRKKSKRKHDEILQFDGDVSLPTKAKCVEVAGDVEHLKQEDSAEIPNQAKKKRLDPNDCEPATRRTADIDAFKEPASKSSSAEELCITCNGNAKNGAFLHGKSAHVCCCYQCANRTWRTSKRCPICNRKVSNVVKVFAI